MATIRFILRPPQHISIKSLSSRSPIRQISSCPCIPSSHPIDTTSPLQHTSPVYHTHLLLHTGKNDWTSKIDFESWPYGDLISALRARLKASPERKVLLGLSSFPASSTSTGATGVVGTEVKALLLPTHQTISSSLTDRESVEEFAGRLVSAAIAPRTSAKVKGVTILICSHGGRDIRCGILGPWLGERILEILKEEKWRGVFEAEEKATNEVSERIPVRVGLASHVGGHKWAGNVIFYFDYGGEDGDGKVRGIWYGRVNESNVESVLAKTLSGFLSDADEKGMVVEELCRGTVY